MLLGAYLTTVLISLGIDAKIINEFNKKAKLVKSEDKSFIKGLLGFIVLILLPGVNVASSLYFANHKDEIYEENIKPDVVRTEYDPLQTDEMETLYESLNTIKKTSVYLMEETANKNYEDMTRKEKILYLKALLLQFTDYLEKNIELPEDQKTLKL